MSFLPALPGFDANTTGQAELIKALQVGTPGIAPGNAGGLVYQDLSNTISTLTSTAADLKLQPILPVLTATSMVYEYNRLLAYGGNGSDSIYQTEVDVPLDDSANYQKKQLALKFVGKRGYTSDVSRLVNAVVDLETQEVMTQGMALMRHIESQLFKGSSALNPLAFDGFETLILQNSPASNIYDAQGGDLTFDMVSDLTAVVRDAPNYGNITHLFMNQQVRSRYNRTFYPLGRYGLMDGGARTVNMQFAGAKDDMSEYEIIGSPFIEPGATGIINPNQDFTQSPSAPTTTAPTAAAPAAGQKSSFISSDAGVYTYAVQAVNKFGKSALVTANTTPLAVAAGQVVSFTATMGGSVKPDYFIVFRSDKTGSPSTFGEIGRVANIIGNTGPAPVSIIDGNARRPGTTNVYFFSMDESVMGIVKLMSLMKIDLAKVRTSKDFMLCSVLAPILKAETKVGMIRNVRRPSSSLLA